MRTWVAVFAISLLPLLAGCWKQSTLPSLFSKTNILPTLYTITGTKDCKITPLTGGLSDSTIYKVENKDKQWVVRFIGHRSMEDKLREINAQSIASQEGWGPLLYASDSDQGWIIMDYIKPTLLSASDRMNEETYIKLGRCLQKIHTGPAFFSGKPIVQEIEELLSKLQQTNKIPRSINYKVLKEIIASVKKNYPRTIAPTHRDLNPNNIIFSDNKIFVIDFENAAQDDPFYDLATIGIFYIFHPYHEKIFLNSYFNRDYTLQEYAYYQEMKQLAFLFYGFNFLDFIPEKVIQTTSVTVQPIAQLLEDLGRGVINIADPIDQLKIAVSMLQEAINLYENVTN
jgi:thiamine kinase-like enzyme